MIMPEKRVRTFIEWFNDQNALRKSYGDEPKRGMKPPPKRRRFPFDSNINLAYRTACMLSKFRALRKPLNSSA